MKKFISFQCSERHFKKIKKDSTGRPLLAISQPHDDYFNDNLDHFYDEDDYFDYSKPLDSTVCLEDKTYTHSHKSAH